MLPAQWADEETRDYIIGSGAIKGYPWYEDYTLLPDRTGVTVKMSDPEDARVHPVVLLI